MPRQPIDLDYLFPSINPLDQELLGEPLEYGPLRERVPKGWAERRGFARVVTTPIGAAPEGSAPHDNIRHMSPIDGAPGPTHVGESDETDRESTDMIDEDGSPPEETAPDEGPPVEAPPDDGGPPDDDGSPPDDGSPGVAPGVAPPGVPVASVPPGIFPLRRPTPTAALRALTAAHPTAHPAGRVAARLKARDPRTVASVRKLAVAARTSPVAMKTLNTIAFSYRRAAVPVAKPAQRYQAKAKGKVKARVRIHGDMISGAAAAVSDMALFPARFVAGALGDALRTLGEVLIDLEDKTK